MNRMYKIARYVPMNHPIVPGGLNGEETYYGLEKAKKAMRQTVVEKFAGAEKLISKIDEYREKYYPENTPPEFEMLKSLITEVLGDPSFPKSEADLKSKYDWFDFEDERIRFEFDDALLCVGESGITTVPVLDIEILDDDKEIFIEGLISCFIMKDFPYEDISYRCWLSAGVFYGLDIEFTLLNEDVTCEEEDVDFDDEVQQKTADENVFEKENISTVDRDDLPNSFTLLGNETVYDIKEKRQHWWKCPNCGGEITFDSIVEEFDETLGENQFITVYSWHCDDCRKHGDVYATVNPLFISYESDDGDDEYDD